MQLYTRLDLKLLSVNTNQNSSP